MISIDQAVSLVALWHDRWCGDLQDSFKQPLEMPGYHITPKGGRAAGRYILKGNYCQYSLPYVVMIGERYEEIVVHEIAHSVTCQLWRKSAWHGEMFKWIMREVAGYSRHECRHHYDVELATRLGVIFTDAWQSDQLHRHPVIYPRKKR